jgi:hypothetical protein
MATFNLQLVRKVATSSDVEVSGTVQGNLSLADIMHSGFTTLTATSWSATLLAGQLTKDLVIETSKDSQSEVNEGWLLAANGADCLIQVLDDDASVITRAVPVGNRFGGFPLSGTYNSGAAWNDGKSLAYNAANQTIFQVSPSIAPDASGVRPIIGGRPCLLEWEWCVYGANNPVYFEMNYAGTSNKFLTIDARPAPQRFIVAVAGGTSWDIFFTPFPQGYAEIWQLFFQGSTMSLYINGDFKFNTPHGLGISNLASVNNMNIFLKSGATGGVAVSQFKATSGFFNWAPGVLS